MALRATYLCENCGNNFDATSGNLMRSKEFRCSECDSTEYVLYGEVEAFDHKCKKCEGKMEVFNYPMCQKCKTRKVKIVQNLMMID